MKIQPKGNINPFLVSIEVDLRFSLLSVIGRRRLCVFFCPLLSRRTATASLRCCYCCVVARSLLGFRFFKSSGDDGSLAVDYFTFSSSIAESLRSASLVISHAGSGSIFETLCLRKPLIVVVNEDLMDNHQIELAEELAEREHLFCAHPQTLYQTLTNMNLDSLIPYPAGEAKPVANLINKFLGFPEDSQNYTSRIT